MSPRAHDSEAGGSGSARPESEAPPAPLIDLHVASVQSELAQLTSTVRLLAESLIATQARADQREQRQEERFQFLIEQQQRQQDMFQFQMNYLYQQTSIPMPQYPLLAVP